MSRTFRLVAGFLLVGLLAVVVSSCVHTYRFYNGHAKDSEEVAFIKGKYSGDGDHIIIIAVDDKILNLDHGKFAIEYTNVEVLPGPHKIMAGATFSKPFKTGPRRLNGEVQVDAQAGHRYQLHAKLNEKNRVEVSIEDITDK
jgi:hypothetical protein